MSSATEPTEKKIPPFGNGRRAEILTVRQPVEGEEYWEALRMGMPAAKAAIIVVGSTTAFPTRLKNRIIDLLGRGVVQAALDREAIILDQAAKAGVSEILGQVVADRGRKTKLVGVVSRAQTSSPDESVADNVKSLDTNHTHYVVVGEDWPVRQAEILCSLAQAAIQNQAAAQNEVGIQNKDWIMTVLVGGELEGPALEAALETVRRKWNLVVIEGSGPLADKIVRLQKEIQAMGKRTGRVWNQINPYRAFSGLRRLQETNPRLYEIIKDGNIMIVGTNFDAIQFRNLIIGTFTNPPKENILWTAWRRFAEYDLNSIRHRNRWKKLKDFAIYLGVSSTLLVLIYSTADIDPTAQIAGDQNRLWIGLYSSFMGLLARIRDNEILDLIFRFMIILLPITSSIILGAETRLKLSSKYILLRGAAESIKRGIYSYRVLSKHGGPKPEGMLPYNEEGLAAHLTKVSKILLDSDVNEAAFAPYGGPIPPNMFGAATDDDGFSSLDPEKYVKIRIGDQLEFYTQRTNQYEKKIRRIQIWMLIFGGIGTFLAAVGAQYWLPLTAAIVSAATAFLEYQQLEQTLLKYNLTKSSLENTRANWLALPEDQRHDPKKVQELVRDVEAILEGENQGWVQYVTQVQESGQGEGTPPPEGTSTP